MPDEEFEHLDASTNEKFVVVESIPKESAQAESFSGVEGRPESDALGIHSDDSVKIAEDNRAEHTSIEDIVGIQASQTPPTTTFYLLPDVFTLIRLPVQIQRLPDFVWQSSFYTISRSPDEISLVCEERLVVQNLDHYGLGNFARIDGNWRILRLGVMDLSLVGVAARFASVLAEAEVNINIISTYDTDYVLVKQGKLSRALDALREAGYTVNTQF